MPQNERKNPPVEYFVKKEYLSSHFKRYFFKSLEYYPERYINLILPHMSIIPLHVAYLCPLCLNSFIYIDTTNKIKTNAEFTDDHYPAKNAGGKNIVLVCKKCNSEAGYQYDFVLKDHLEILSFNNKVPNSVLKSTTSIVGVKGYFKGSLFINKEGEIAVKLKNNPNHFVKPLDDYIADNKHSPINITYRTPENEKIQKALLHAAYLYCFENFGYEFIFSDAGELIRNVLNGKEVYPADVVDLNLDTKVFLEALPIGLCYISKPKILQSLAVNIKLTIKTTGYTCIKTILIPNPTNTGIEDLTTKSRVLKNYVGEVDYIQLKNFLEVGIAQPFKQMWLNLQTEFE